MKKSFLILAFAISGLGCQSTVEKAARNTGYKAFEMVGVEKRDLLKRRVSNARDEQKDASKEFQDALDQLQKIYGFEGGALERRYKSLKSSYEDSAEQAEDVHKSIRKAETVAGDLFEEWQKEIEELHTPELKSKSRQTLSQTRERYGQMIAALKKSESQMDPILSKLKDQVLFLKHNLNAQAIASLKTEGGRIQGDIQKLIAEMKSSTEPADDFIKKLEN